MKLTNKFLLFLLAGIVLACGGAPELEITEEEIDEYVASRNSPEAVYDITFSLRFTQGLETSYEVTQYEVGDSLVLHQEEFMNAEKQIDRSIYYMDDLPVYVAEYEADYSGEGLTIYERKIYLNGAKVINAYERSGIDENEVERAEFQAFETKFSDYDFQKPMDAIDQEGEFALEFEEMLQISSSSWVVAGNDESGYEVALLVLEWDQRLVEMRDSPGNFVDRRMKFYHSYSNAGGIKSIVYVSSEFVE